MGGVQIFSHCLIIGWDHNRHCKGGGLSNPPSLANFLNKLKKKTMADMYVKLMVPTTASISRPYKIRKIRREVLTTSSFSDIMSRDFGSKTANVKGLLEQKSFGSRTKAKNVKRFEIECSKNDISYFHNF